MGDTLSEMRHLLDRSTRIDVDSLIGHERLDLRLARGFLEIEIWEAESSHFQQGNPSLYTGEAIFSLISLFLTDFAPFDDRVASAVERMHGVERLLGQARDNVTEAPAAWTERAIGECDGALAFLTEGVEALVATSAREPRGLMSAARRAARAFDVHRSHLGSVLRHRPSHGCAAGEEALDLYLRKAHFLEMGSAELLEHAESELERATASLREQAPDVGAADPAGALAKLRDLHPDVERYYQRYHEVWDEARAFAEKHALVSWPEFPIRYVPRPVWSRKAAPHLYFLHYRSPPAFNRPPIHDYLVTPVDRALPIDERESRLRATNDAVIKLNHVIHHGGLGHHVQNWHAFRSASRVGRIAAVDCANRIAMSCGGTMAEGWATYATDVMAEFGALTPLEAYAQHAARARMCARAIVDVRLHQGRFSLADAAAYYERHAYMTPHAARYEAVKNSMFPGAALIYLTGNDGIHDLRRTMTQKRGAAFSLRGFHDELLSYGSVPVALIANAMTSEAQ